MRLSFIFKSTLGCGWCSEVEPLPGTLKTWGSRLTSVHTKPNQIKSMLNLHRWLVLQIFHLNLMAILLDRVWQILLIWHYSFENIQINWNYWTSPPCLFISSMLLFESQCHAAAPNNVPLPDLPFNNFSAFSFPPDLCLSPAIQINKHLLTP